MGQRPNRRPSTSGPNNIEPTRLAPSDRPSILGTNTALDVICASQSVTHCKLTTMTRIMKEPAPRSLQNVLVLRNVTESARLKLERQCFWRNVCEKNSIIDYRDSTNDVYFL